MTRTDDQAPLSREAFEAELLALGLKQVDLRRAVERLTGHELHKTSTSRWLHGARGVNPLAVAVLRLLALLPARKREELTKR